MKKAGVIAASIGTAALMALGAVAFVASISHPSDLVEEASANDTLPAAQAAGVVSSAPAEVTPALQGPRMKRALVPEERLVRPIGRTESNRSAPTQSRSGDEDDDDDGADD